MGTAVEYIRHECGHLIVAKAMGFRTGSITLEPDRAGAHLDIVPSCPELTDVENFIERRVIVLYAGAIAQSLRAKQITESEVRRLLTSTALDDWRKIQEYVRLLAGIKHPGCKTAEEFAPKLAQVDRYIANKAGETVERYIELILILTNFFIERLKANSVRGRPPGRFELSAEEIDSHPDIKAGFADQDGEVPAPIV